MRRDYALTPAQRMDARAALALLDGTGMTLEQAARIAAEGKRALRRITVAIAADTFLRTRLDLRPRTAGWYMVQINSFTAKFGERMFDEVSRADFREWIADASLGHAARASRIRAVKALWRWGMAQEPALVVQDITTGVSGQLARRSADVLFLTVDECEAIMAGAGRFRAALALMLFAGIRPNEVSAEDKPPLLWRHVNAAERIIRIPGEIAKTGRARLIEGLPETLWHWLGVARKPDDAICPAQCRQAVELAKGLAGYGPKRKWPHDALRHTFATYHVAAFNSPGQTAMLMGHEGNPTMLHRHYRGLATKIEAVKFWALRP